MKYRIVLTLLLLAIVAFALVARQHAVDMPEEAPPGVQPAPNFNLS